MASAFDNRLVSLAIQTQQKTYTFDQSYFIRAHGSKNASPLLSPGEFRIDNIDRDLRNYLLTACSPFSQQNFQDKGSAPLPLVTLSVGRTSVPLFVVSQGNCIATAPTQPPDIGITLKTMQGVLLLLQSFTMTQPQNVLLSELSLQVANNLGFSLEFTASDKQIDNFSFTGNAYTQINKLAECGNIDVFIDNKTLVVKNTGTPRKGSVPVISSQTGLVNVPVINEYGLQLRMLINSDIRIGGAIQVVSQINPAANGIWYIYRIDYDISTWETPFYWNIYARLTQLITNTTP